MPKFTSEMIETFQSVITVTSSGNFNRYFRSANSLKPTENEITWEVDTNIELPFGFNVNEFYSEYGTISGRTLTLNLTEELDDVDGIGEIRAKNIKQGIKRMHEQVIYDSKLFYR